MKKLVIVLGLIFSLAFVQQSDAQIRVNANINIGSQPLWGPVGYDYVDYYYLPDADVYYYVPERRFIYLDAGRWIFAASLPTRFGNINLYTAPKIVINEPKPYLKADVYRVKYRGWKGPKQIVIRDSDDERYRNHPGRAVGHSKGKGKGKSKG